MTKQRVSITRWFERATKVLGLLVVTAVVSVLARAVPAEPRRRSLSIGGPNGGKLVNGVRLPSRGKGFLSNPGRTNADADWGTEELVSAIIQIGADVERWAPGAKLVVNDLGFAEGGEIPHHKSHQAGRDVDTLFYINGLDGRPLPARAARFDSNGRGRTPGGAQVLFDTSRNWLVLKSLVTNPRAHLQRVFVAEPLRTLMLRHARELGEPSWIIERAGEAMCQPAVPHDDHFHIRLFCTAEDYRAGCRDAWPIYPWRRTELARLGIEAVETAPPRPVPRRRRRAHRRRVARDFGRVWCPG